MSIGTGKFLTDEEKAKALELVRDAKTAPVITMRSDLPTFAESAWERLYEWIEERAIEKGLPQFEDMWYGLSNDGEINWPDGYRPAPRSSTTRRGISPTCP